MGGSAILDLHEIDILDGIATERVAMIDRVRRWATINSGSANLAGLDRMAHHPIGALDVLGSRTQCVAAAPTTAIDGHHDTPIHLYGGFSRPPKPFDAVQAPLFDVVRACGADLGLPMAWRDTGGVCNGNTIAATGIPVVDTMGVRGGRIHSGEEFLVVDSLVERAQLSALALMRLARGDGPTITPDAPEEA